MTGKEIISNLARERVVEALCLNVAHSGTMSADIKDLAQIVYLALLEYDPKKIAGIYQSGGIKFFVSRIIINQYRSKTSPFYRLIRDFGGRSEEYSPADYDANLAIGTAEV